MSDTAINAASQSDEALSATTEAQDTATRAAAAMPDPVQPDPVQPDPLTSERENAAQVAAPPARRGLPVLFGAVLGAALAVGAGYGVQNYLVPPQAFDPSLLEARLTAAEAETSGLRAQVAQLSELAAAPTPPDDALLDRIAALEARQAPDTAPLLSRLDQLEANLAALANLPSETGVAPAALAALQAEVAALQAEVAALKSQSTGVPAEISATAASVEALLAEAEVRANDLAAQTASLVAATLRDAALGQIAAALDSGLPYGAALTALADADVPAALAAQAETGVATLASLRDAFPDVARRALEQALRADSGAGWTDRVTAFLRNQTGARSLTPREGNDPDAILSRAEAALGRADLPGALAEIAALPPAAQTELAEWTARAQLRLDAAAGLNTLLQTAGR